MAKSGYFGEGFISQDADAATDQFLTGKAAMKYDGTWLLSNINDETQNQIGVDNVGFMPFPAVDGGAGKHRPVARERRCARWPSTRRPRARRSRTGSPASPRTTASRRFRTPVSLSGFKVNGEVTDVPETTTDGAGEDGRDRRDRAVVRSAAGREVATRSPRPTSSLLTTGQMTPEQYMADLQASVDAAP